MKKGLCVSLAVAAMLLVNAASGFAWWRGGVWIGPGWGGPYPYYAYPYYAPPVVTQPVIIQQQAPEVYVQQAPQSAPQQPVEQAYWYFCPDPQGYYPYVKQCPKGWMKVVPTPPAAQPAP